jgi:hypothetical protein
MLATRVASSMKTTEKPTTKSTVPASTRPRPADFTSGGRVCTATAPPAGSFFGGTPSAASRSAPASPVT